MSDPKDIIDRAIKRYAECGSYTDSGFIWNLGEPNSRKEFKTYFVRPDLFRFEWNNCDPTAGRKGKAQQFAIWSDGSSVFQRYHSHGHRIQKLQTLAMAAASASSISGGTINIIYSLLFPQNGSPSFLLRLKDLTKNRTAAVLGDRCYHLQGTDSQKTMELWLDRSNYALRKMKENKVITAAFMAQVDQDLQQRNPDLYAQMHGNGETPGPYVDKKLIRECKYTNVFFDIEIEDKVFHPEFDH